MLADITCIANRSIHATNAVTLLCFYIQASWNRVDIHDPLLNTQLKLSRQNGQGLEHSRSTDAILCLLQTNCVQFPRTLQENHGPASGFVIMAMVARMSCLRELVVYCSYDHAALFSWILSTRTTLRTLELRMESTGINYFQAWHWQCFEVAMHVPARSCFSEQDRVTLMIAISSM